MAKKTKPEEKGVLSPITVDSLFGDRSDEEKRADRLALIAQQQIKTSVQYKEKRMQEIQKSIDLYEGRTKKALKGRWNVPLPLMSGYVDTLLSKTDDAPKVKFGYQDIADMERAAKVQSKWEQDSGDVAEQWALKDRMEKKLASFSGVGVSQVYAYTDDKGVYHSVYDVIDYADFECEPLGGQILKNHKYHGHRNIFKTKDELFTDSTGDNAIYSKRQVLKLTQTFTSSEHRQFEKIFQEKTDRLRALGFNVEQGSYVGMPIFNFTQWIMVDPENGEKYYLLLEPHSGIWIRGCPLKEAFESNESPYTVWHTHPDAFNFWSKSPADDMRPIAESMNVIFNQALDSRDRNIYRQRAFDPAVFADPAQLEWRADGLVEVVSGTSSTHAIGNGIFEFGVNGMTEKGSIDLMEFMDNLTGMKTGVTAAAQGAGENEKVGIYFGNLQQVADRLGLYNKSYSEAWGQKGLRFYWGLREHATDDLMVKMIGEGGYNWSLLSKEDLNPTRSFNITIVGGQAEAAQDEILKKTKAAALELLVMNPAFVSKLNPEVTIEEVLRNGGWEEEAIKRFLSMQSPGSELLISRAHQAIQQILEGKTPELVRGATTLFMQTIVNYCDDASDLPLEKYTQLMAYAQAHQQIAMDNAMRDVQMKTAAMGAPAAGAAPTGETGGAPVNGGAPIVPPGSPAADMTGYNDVGLTPEAAKRTL